MNWHTLPPLASLRAFAALAQTGSFTRAGAALNVSHAAVSQQVRALEERLGVALVGRNGRKLVLTSDGERLAASLDGAFRTIRRAVDEAIGADATRPLQVSMTSSFAVSWLMPRLSEFRREHPEVELMLNPTPEVVTLEPGGVDLAIRFGAGHWPGVASEPLVLTSFVVVATPDLIGDRRGLGADDLLDLPWIQELGTSEVAAWLEREGVVAPRPANIIHLPGNLALEAMRRGEGIWATARLFVERDLAEGRLVLLFEDHRPDEGYHIVTRPGVMRPPLRAFVSWLKRQARSDGRVADPSGRVRT